MQQLEPPVDGSAVLEGLLTRSGVDYRRDGTRFQFVLTRRGCKWQTVCNGLEGLVLVYGIHPARVTNPDAALRLCDALNRQVVRGSFFRQEEHLLFRTGADLFRRCDAAEAAARALEYNAAVLSRFWTQLAAAAERTP